MMARVMVRIERPTLLGPIGQYLHEFAALKPGAESQLQTLEHPLPRHTGSDRGRRIVRRESAANVYFYHLALPRELPGKRSTRLRIAKQQRLVMDQVVRRWGHAAFLNVGGSGTGQHSRLKQLTTDERRVVCWSETNGHVHARHHLLSMGAHGHFH